MTGGRPVTPIDLGHLQAEQGYLALTTYSHAKAVLLVLSYEFAQRLFASGVTLNFVSPVRPATAMTEQLTSAMLPWWGARSGQSFAR